VLSDPSTIKDAFSSWVERFTHSTYNMNWIQTHLKMYFPAGWRVPRSPLSLNGIQTHSKMYTPAGWRVSRAPLGACLLSRPEVRLVNELGASVPFVGNHATQVARVPCVHPLETQVQRVVIMWFRNSDWVSTHRRWFVLNWPRGLWLFSSSGYIVSSYNLLAKSWKIKFTWSVWGSRRCLIVSNGFFDKHLYNI